MNFEITTTNMRKIIIPCNTEDEALGIVKNMLQDLEEVLMIYSSK